MLRSTGFRFIVVAVLALFMYVPMFFVGEVIGARADYSRQTVDSVGAEWGGAQLFSGPQLVIPVEEEVTLQKSRPVLDPATGQARRDRDGNEIVEYYDVTEIVAREPVFIFPDRFDLTVTSTSSERYRGIFTAPVYEARAEMLFDFPAARATEALTGKEVLLWEQAELRIYVAENRALRGEAVLTAAGRTLGMEPLPTGTAPAGGIFAPTGDPRELGEVSLVLGFNGAQSIMATPVGRDSRVSIASDWPHPSFFGAFLPNEQEVTAQGFTARWDIPHLARALPQIARLNHDGDGRASASFGVRFFQPNDFYQKAFRAARYGILFIGLTFLTILLIDRTAQRPAHPVHYILVGLAQSIFVLLMVAYAEQIGFLPAYAMSAGATVALLGMFGATAMKLGRRTLLLVTLLILLYAVLYLILESTDYALLAGSTLSFLALALTMYLTRNENWYGGDAASDRPGVGTLLWQKITEGTDLAPKPPAAGQADP